MKQPVDSKQWGSQSGICHTYPSFLHLVRTPNWASKMTPEEEGHVPNREACDAAERTISLERVLSWVFTSPTARKPRAVTTVAKVHLSQVQKEGRRWSATIENVCLFLNMLLCIGVRLPPSIRGESIIFDFDPYFNHRTTKYLARHGFAEFWNWYDDTSWYPLGRPVGQTLFPGLMTTSYVIYQLLRSLGLIVHVSQVSTFLPPVFSCLTALVAHAFVKHATGSRVAGLFASFFVGISPAYIRNSLVGSYDNECVAIFAMLTGFCMWTRAIQKGAMLPALMAAIPSAYMVTSWGGYVFLLNAIACHMVALAVLGSLTPRHQVVYVVFYVVITAVCANVPFLGFPAILSSEHMASHVVFFYVVALAVTQFLSSLLPKESIKYLLNLVLGTAVVLLVVIASILILTGKTGWQSRSLTLLDPTYATKYIPIIASVSEHQPTTWTSYFVDLHMAIFLAPMGLVISLRRGGGLFFLALYGVLASYFSAIMVRLMLVLSPAAAMLAAVAAAFFVTGIFTHGKQWTGKKREASAVPLTLTVPLLIVFFWMCVMYLTHCTWLSSTVFSNRSIFPGGSIRRADAPRPDDFREAYHWFRQNTHPEAKLLAWWDYGYQASDLSSRTVLVDNNTWNNTHIATVGLTLASEESVAYTVAQDLDVDYIFVVFGGLARFSGDDMNKLIWMVRITSGVYPSIQQSDFLGERGQYTVGKEAPGGLQRSLLYKLSYHRFGQATKGFDFARKVDVAHTDFELQHFEEVYTTENWIVRIYKVRKTDNRDAKMYNTVESALL
ncbi:hypothetical protein Efla_007573 [Eimeria flavescens]